jgi:hypothetical protein
MSSRYQSASSSTAVDICSIIVTHENLTVFAQYRVKHLCAHRALTYIS